MECITPFLITNHMGSKVPVPCGRCPGCFKRRVSQWSFRLMQEDKVSQSSVFITLTYGDSVPLSNNRFMSLDKRDVQLFLKRLRKSQCTALARKTSTVGEKAIKYYCVGEYGERYSRPHYHALLFNADVKLIQSAWNLGQVHYGSVSGASVGYTLKYMCKGPWRPKHHNDDRCPQFALMSKGLGKDYLTYEMVNWHLEDPQNRMYVNLKDGRKVGMPRYYKEKIYWPSLQKAVGQVTRARMVEERDLAIARGGDSYFGDQAAAHLAAFQRVEFDLRQNGQF